MTRILLSVLMATLFFLPSPAAADEVVDQLQGAIKLYQEGKINEALEELDFVTNQLRQRKAEGMGELFPEPLPGWKAEEFQSQAMGQALFGGAIQASREYQQEGGEGRATIEIISDSPMVQSLGMMLNNPALAAGQKNTKLIRVNRQKALLTQESSQEAELTLILDGKVLIKVSVEGMDQAGETAQAYGEKIDLEKIRQATM